jgi:hypothetical protein
MSKKTSFPQKLFALLQDECTEVISWNEDGRAFRIHDHPTFCTDILPRYFCLHFLPLAQSFVLTIPLMAPHDKAAHSLSLLVWTAGISGTPSSQVFSAN